MGILSDPGPSSLPTIGETRHRSQMMEAKRRSAESQRIIDWYKAHPDRAIKILGPDGAASLGIESEAWRRKKMQEEVEQTGKEWEAKYTAKQKADIARIQNGVQQAQSSGLFSPEEMTAVERQAQIKIIGISPQIIPKTAQEKKMAEWAKEGKGVGQEWVDEQGNVKTREPDGTIKTQTPYDKTRDGIQAKIQLEREKDLSATRLKLMGQTVEDPASGRKSSRYDDSQIETMLERAYPWYHEQRVQQAIETDQMMQQYNTQQQQQRQQQQQQALSELDPAVASVLESTQLQEEDLDLPAEAAQAQSVLRTLSQRYPGGIPEGQTSLRELAMKARMVLEQLMSGEQQPGQSAAPQQQPSSPQRQPAGVDPVDAAAAAGWKRGI